MFKFLIFFPLLILLCSCVTPRAEFQSKIYKPKKKGVIKYSLSRVPFQSDAVNLRKLDAKAKMEAFCGSQKPEILLENKENENVGYHSNTSYHQNTIGGVAPSPLTVGGVQAGGITIGGVSTGGVAAGGLTTGSSITYSSPVVRGYNVIHFECK